MKVFISWSGDRSKAVAEELRDWLPTIVQSVEPFISTQDVPVGGRGLNVLASKLQNCSFGILCLTQDNKQAPWIHFEAGALSKVIDASRVVPLLLDLKVSDLTGPLVQFQAIAMDRDGIFSLVKALAERSSPSVGESRLQRLFNALWPDLEAKVSQLKVAVADRPKQGSRSEKDILEEILLLSRSAERQIARVITAQAAAGVPPSTIPGSGRPSPAQLDARERVTVGDVWDAFDASDFQPASVQGALGTAYVEGHDGQKVTLPNQGFMDWGVASDDLLVVLAAWGVRPVVSRKYPAPDDVTAENANSPWGSVIQAADDPPPQPGTTYSLGVHFAVGLDLDVPRSEIVLVSLSACQSPQLSPRHGTYVARRHTPATKPTHGALSKPGLSHQARARLPA
jgi:hypothetical protein